MKKIIFYLCFLLSLFECYSQMDTTKWMFMSIRSNGDTIWVQKPSVADKYRDAGEYEKAITEYKRMCASDPSDENSLYSLACIYSIIGKKDSAFKYIAIATKNDAGMHILSDPDFYNLSTDARWIKIEDAQIKKMETKRGRKYENVEVTKELWRIGMRDQAYYSEIAIAEKKYGHKSRASDSLWKLKEKLNEKNLTSVKNIIDKYGWPKGSVFGRGATNAAFLVIQHSEYETQKKYLPLLKEACKNNEANWESFALMKDRILIDEKKPQIYGSQLNYNDKLKVYELAPLEDPSNVDKRRATVGLGPLKDYVKHWKVEFNVQQNK